MTLNAQAHLAAELAAVIERHRYEYELTYAEVVGCLEMVKFDVLLESTEPDDDDDGDDDDDDGGGIGPTDEWGDPDGYVTDMHGDPTQ